MLIVLDTNVVFSDPRLEKADALAVKNAADKLGYRLTLPEVVFDEAIGKRKEQIKETVHKLISALRELKSRGIEHDPVIPGDSDISEAIAKYTSHLNRLFPQDVRLPYPEEAHAAVAQRAISKRRPFMGHDRGYRDTLIWLAIMSFLKDSNEPVKLVSADSAFRKSKDTNELHEDLLRDLTSEGIDTTRLALYKGLGQLVGDLVAPQLDTLEDIKTLLEDTLLSGDNLGDQVSILLNESIDEVQLGSYKESDYFTVDVIEDVVFEETTDLRRLPKGEVFVRTVWTCEVSPDTSPFTYTYLPHSGDEGGYISARATIDLVLGSSDYEVIAVDVVEFEVDD